MQARFPKFLLLINLLVGVVTAQNSAPIHGISGTVQDQSGALIPGAHIVILAGDGHTIAQGTSDNGGSFSFPNIGVGSYVVDVTRDGFSEVKQPAKLGAQGCSALQIVMQVAIVSQEVTVAAPDSSAQVSAEISQNQSGNTVHRDVLDRLPVFDQDYITTMSRFLDSNSTGTNGVTLVVNAVEANGPGVTASAIQSVKINQNPYTAIYSRPGRARIEITTKGGTPELHGSANFLYRDSVFDATNAFAATKPSETCTYYEGSLTGPLSHDKKTTFLLALDDEHNDQQAVVVAVGPNGAINENVPNPTHHYFLSGRVFHDYREGKQLWIGYSYEHRAVQNQGVGGTVLPEAGTDTYFLEHEINVGYNVTISPRLLNQLHFLVGHNDNRFRA